MHSPKPDTHLCRIPLCNEYLATSCSKLDGEKKRNIFLSLEAIKDDKSQEEKTDLFMFIKNIFRLQSQCSALMLADLHFYYDFR